MVELVGIERPQWIANIQFADSSVTPRQIPILWMTGA